ECPDELASCVMRCLEKEPEARWPTADALRRALESRTARAYRVGVGGRRSSGTRPLRAPSPAPGGGGPGGGIGTGRDPGRSQFPIPRSPNIPRRARRGEAGASKPGESGALASGGEPEIVRVTRSRFVTWISVFSGVTLVNAIQGGGLSWALFLVGEIGRAHV